MKKKFHYNGKYLGDFDSTGDPVLDMPNINRLLKEHGIEEPELPPYLAMYRQAHAFSKTSALLYERIIKPPHPDPAAVSPFVVNITFSIEIYLKSLALKHGKQLHGHELEKLFKKLPSAGKDDISQALLSQAGSRWIVAGTTKTIRDLQSTARDLNTAFVDWRYHYEKPNEPLGLNFSEAILLAEILHVACLSGKKTVLHGI